MPELDAGPNELNMSTVVDNESHQLLSYSLLQQLLAESNDRLTQARDVLHDVNNQFLVIYFACNELLRVLPNESPHRSMVVAIDKARSRAAELAQSFRDSHEEHSKIRGVDLNALIIAAEQLFRRVAKDSVVFTLKLAHEPAYIDVNPDAVDRLLTRLILNSLATLPDGGWITIETSHDASADRDSSEDANPTSTGRVSLRILDTGSDLDCTAGMGQLSINDSAMSASKVEDIELLVQQCGAMMTVVTSAEFGRRTQVSFPSASSVSEKSSHEKVSSEIQDRLGAILLIEDDALLQTFIKTILAGEGYELIVAEDGEHAMEAATRHHGRISLLITDLRLPGTSGDEVANHFWKIYPGLPVLYISGQLEQNCHLKNFSRYVTSFLQKPFQVKDLISRVEELLDRPAKAS